MFKKGTIILVPFPFTDLTDVKVRPALIVSTNSKSQDIVVLFISSKVINGKVSETDFVIIPDKVNGLKANSVVKCNKFATIERKIVIGEIGNLSEAEIEKVNQRMIKVLGL